MSAALELVAAVVGSNVLTAGLTNWATRRKLAASISVDESSANKMDIEAAQLLVNTAVTLVAPLQSQITDLSTRVGTLEAENVAAKAHFQLAIAYIRDLWAWIDRHMPGRKPPAPPDALNLT